MEKAFEIQKQIRDNAKTFNSYMTDLQNWEAEMKRKEAALSGEFEQVVPPVRSKAKKENPVQAKKKPESRIKSSDYHSWEKFDAEKACEDIDMKDVGPVSLDSKKSFAAKMEKLREEAQHAKETGNMFVKQEKWDQAISCYNRAIELVKDNAIYYANRGLCYLKIDSLHQAESDCTEALRLEPNYVKALQRRATARERLGSLRAASNDLIQVLKLEPKNRAAQAQLEIIKARMGTKGAKSKSSPTSTDESKSLPKSQPMIIELEDPIPEPEPEPSADEKWRNGEGENITVLKPVKKPPHLRSKRALKAVQIHEIPFGKSSPTRIEIIEIENIDNENAGGDSIGPESVELASEALLKVKESQVASQVPPANSFQFMAEWKYLKGWDIDRSQYFSLIDPSKIPEIFDNALETYVLTDWLRSLLSAPERFEKYGVTAYLTALTKVKRFPALAMFLGRKDRQIVDKLLEYCQYMEKAGATTIRDLRIKFEMGSFIIHEM